MLCDTYQSVEIESKEGKRFLRQVIRDCDWRERASAGTDWRVEVSRTIKGATGQPDTTVTVRTDAVVGKSGKLGLVQAFSDSKPVQVVAPSAMFCWNTESAVLAKMLLDGSRLTICASSGSTHSSQLGLAFYRLEATISGCAYGSVVVGCETVSKDGQTIISGAVSIN